jgi:uridine kinase
MHELYSPRLKILNKCPNIIAISGCPGGGKTSLCRALASHYYSTTSSIETPLSAPQTLQDQSSPVRLLSNESSLGIIHYDHFQQVTDHSIEAISKWSEEGGDYDALDLPLLEAALSKLRLGKSVKDPISGLEINASQTVFFETPLGRSHSKTAQYIDKLIWIDTPLDVALARNITDIINGFKESLKLGASSKKQTLEFLHWQAGYVAHYMSTVRELLLSQREKAFANADIILDGNLPLDKVSEQAIELLGDIL